MTENYKDFYDNAKVESAQFDLEDAVCRGKNYFLCGFKKLGEQNGMYYNNDFAVALAAIGRLYTDKDGASDYKRGVDYVAGRAKTSKRHVKVLRKKYKAHIRKEEGYVFRTPFDMPLILETMITLLQEKKAEPLIVDVLKEYHGRMYREFLAEKQFLAVEISAGKDNATDGIKNTYNKLNNIVCKI